MQKDPIPSGAFSQMEAPSKSNAKILFGLAVAVVLSVIGLSAWKRARKSRKERIDEDK